MKKRFSYVMAVMLPPIFGVLGSTLYLQELGTAINARHSVLWDRYLTHRRGYRDPTAALSIAHELSRGGFGIPTGHGYGSLFGIVSTLIRTFLSMMTVMQMVFASDDGDKRPINGTFERGNAGTRLQSDKVPQIDSETLLLCSTSTHHDLRDQGFRGPQPLSLSHWRRLWRGTLLKEPVNLKTTRMLRERERSLHCLLPLSPQSPSGS